MPHNKASKITLALPFSGPLAEAAKAIREGFMAAYYEHRSKHNEQALTIRFFDTNKTDIKSIYQTSPTRSQLTKENSSELVIGPLDKPTLKELDKIDHISIPTIALNSPTLPSARENLFTLSYAPESEAEIIIKHLVKEGITNTGVLIPATAYGYRMLSALESSSIDYSTKIITTSEYTDDVSVSKAIAELLSTLDSKQRSRKIRNIIGQNVISTPRPRKDLDAIIMIAEPEIAKQIKPLLAFNYSSDLPVYASSLVNQAAFLDRGHDLNGVIFPDMPWMLSDAIDTKQNIARNLPNKSRIYSRFYAIGVDTFSLAPRIHLLAAVKNSQMQGVTGTLSISEHNTFQRDLTWATFNKGKIIRIR
ncbi:MAG: hypothetical protein CUN55_15780, partial [Phototrophicales bacterium]